MSIETPYAIYVGSVSREGDGDGVAMFYGIPYAEPPIKEGRFRAPRPLTCELSSNGSKPRIDATKEPAFAIQGAADPYGGNHGGAGSEVCLHLNIYAPACITEPANASKIPVLVYIHGGGYTYGNPLSWPFEHWIRQSPEFIVVSVYYRLSIFGFLASPEEEGMDWNVGFLDQIEALRWVQKNITFFGGDSDRVTIAGQSAGAGSVLLHLLNHHSDETLFHQAIAQSVYRPSIPYPRDLQAFFDFVAAYAGCSPGESHEEIMESLKQKNTDTLIKAAEAAQVHDQTWRSLPLVDGKYLTHSPTVMLDKGHLRPVPILVGATSDETYVTSTNLGDELRRWYPLLSDDSMRKLEKIYASEDFGGDELERVKTVVGETLNRSGREMLAEVATKLGQSAYAYRFDEPVPGKEEAHHSADNWWMFRGVETGENGAHSFTPFTWDSQQGFSRELIAYWTSFVRTGDPNTYRLRGSPEWLSWGTGDSEKRRLLLRQGESDENAVYVSGSEMEATPAKELERCRALSAMAEELQF